MILLHLSDLHFGWDAGDARAQAERKLALDGLLELLPALDKEWVPDCVCVTGDVGWRGADSDYDQASAWLESLLRMFGLGPDRLLLCPGNHDSDRSVAKRIARPGRPEEADDVLTLPPPEYLTAAFRAYGELCKRLSIIPPVTPGGSSYLVGRTQIEQVAFVTLNSAWFSRGDDDRSNLWLGLTQLKGLEAAGLLPSPGKVDDGPIVIALLHHPREWFREEELQAWGTRPSTLDYLATRCHLVLTGHTHGEVRPADQFALGAYHLSGGAAFAGAAHFNCFRIIRLDGDRCTYRSFEYQPRSFDNRWSPAGDVQELELRGRARGLRARIAVSAARVLLERYRDTARAAAARLAEAKSRAIRPSGELPSEIHLTVSVHSDDSGVWRSEPATEQRGPTGRTMPLREACKLFRRTLLLGDLGTGKSTLVAQLVPETLDEDGSALAYVVPAKAIRGDEIDTAKALLRGFSRYVTEQVSPTDKAADIEALLASGVDLLLVCDGLDEVSPRRARSLIDQLASGAD